MLPIEEGGMEVHRTLIEHPTTLITRLNEMGPNFLWPCGVGWEVEHIDVKDCLEKFIISTREKFSSLSTLRLPMLTSIILYASSVSKSS